jgi:hypothetical protein
MWTNHRADLHALEGSTTIYAWWFRLRSNIVAGDGFFHIFQVEKIMNMYFFFNAATQSAVFRKYGV